MRKIYAFILTALLVVSLAACGNKTNSGTGGSGMDSNGSSNSSSGSNDSSNSSSGSNDSSNSGSGSGSSNSGSSSGNDSRMGRGSSRSTDMSGSGYGYGYGGGSTALDRTVPYGSTTSDETGFVGGSYNPFNPPNGGSSVYGLTDSGTGRSTGGVTSYQQMLRNGYVHDSDGILTDGENSRS